MIKNEASTVSEKEKTGAHSQKMPFIIKGAYWMGIIADAVWVFGLFSPKILGILTGRPDFDADLITRGIMGIGGTLMLGWTMLLCWAVRDPIKFRFVILLTAFPVVFGMFAISIFEVLSGRTILLWAVIKTLILFASMVTSFILSNRIAKQKYYSQK